MNKKLLGLMGGMILAAGVFMPMQAQAADVTNPNVATPPARSVSVNDPTGFVVLSDVVPDIIQEVRYFSTYNFAYKPEDF